MSALASRRPPGNVGKKVPALVNAFKVTWKLQEKARIHHYDVVITPQFEVNSSEDGNRPPIGARKNMEIITRLQTEVRPELFNPRAAFDGKKNLWSAYPLNLVNGGQSEEFLLPLNRMDSDKPRSNPKMVSVKLVFVAVVNPGVLGPLLAGEVKHFDADGEAATAINMLNVLVRVSPISSWPHNARSFFANKECTSIGGLELWQGYFQSVRPALNNLFINVDISTAAIIPPRRPLKILCADYLKLRDVAALNRLRDDQFMELRTFVKGMRVFIDLPGHKKRSRRVDDIVRNAGKITFQKGIHLTTVAEHFRQAYNKIIPQEGLGIKVGQGEVFPFDVCVTGDAQLYKKKLSPDRVSQMIKFGPPKPENRLEAIRRGWNLLDYDTSDYVRNAGISIDTQPMQVTGRLLPPPSIIFDLDPQKFKEPYHCKEPGVWDMMGKRFRRPATIQRWTVVNFAGETANANALQRFIMDMTKVMRERGMEVSNAHDIVIGSEGDVEGSIGRAGQAARPDFVMVILRENAATTYQRVKRFGDITQGVCTQCVKWVQNFNNYDGRKMNQYQNNLALKINGKMGGVNSGPMNNAMTQLVKEPTIVLGADVSHPAPGEAGKPSTTALVSSCDANALQYIASVRIQQSRLEIIQDLQAMVKHAFQAFRQATKAVPRRVIFYRDGVSEGELYKVVQHEINGAIAGAFAELYGSNTQTWPKLTFIVVGKRHHIRFFPRREDAHARSGNCHAGFVVDRDIVHPTHYDFYLLSHAGIKGTSRPSHYTVIRDDIGMNSDALQELSFGLCHAYARATRSVSIPAPVYYADLVCRRAKFHYDPSWVYQDEDVSIHSGDGITLQEFKKHFGGIAERLERSMYFL